jgi:hypothetical protein
LICFSQHFLRLFDAPYIGDHRTSFAKARGFEESGHYFIGRKKEAFSASDEPASLLLKELSPPGKFNVFTFILCPHTTMPLDLLPWKMDKNQVYKSHEATWCLFSRFIVIWRSRVIFWGVFVDSSVHSSLIANFSTHMDALHTYTRPQTCTHPNKYIAVVSKET